eukprot:Colp12_sorted_trinity150504_noHs@27982
MDKHKSCPVLNPRLVLATGRVRLLLRRTRMGRCGLGHSLHIFVLSTACATGTSLFHLAHLLLQHRRDAGLHLLGVQAQHGTAMLGDGRALLRAVVLLAELQRGGVHRALDAVVAVAVPRAAIAHDLEVLLVAVAAHIRRVIPRRPFSRGIVEVRRVLGGLEGRAGFCIGFSGDFEGTLTLQPTGLATVFPTAEGRLRHAHRLDGGAGHELFGVHVALLVAVSSSSVGDSIPRFCRCRGRESHGGDSCAIVPAARHGRDHLDRRQQTLWHGRGFLRGRFHSQLGHDLQGHIQASRVPKAGSFAAQRGTRGIISGAEAPRRRRVAVTASACVVRVERSVGVLGGQQTPHAQGPLRREAGGGRGGGLAHVAVLCVD